jgi:hypothetical protein
MRHYAAKIASRGWAHSKRWCRDRLQECITCRQCGTAVRFWDECCGHCGCGQPAKVATSAVVAVGAVCALLFIALIVW